MSAPTAIRPELEASLAAREGPLVVPVISDPVLTAPARRSLGGAIKATWEWSAAATGLLIVLPLLVFLALIVRLDSKGSAFFRQTRVGRDGTPFTMLKLRTMHVQDGPDGFVRAPLSTKSKTDPRITRVGRLLRRTSLDELPQLINVLKGEMALIGPRPPLPQEVELYDDHVHQRFAMRPGLTGLWQVSGRADLTWNEAFKMDLTYIDTWTLAKDLKILAKTIPAVLTGRGAY